MSTVATLGLAGALACDLGAIGQAVTATPGSNQGPSAASPAVPLVAVPLETPTSSGTPFPTATLDPDATPVPVNPCRLVTKDEAASAIGAPVMDPVAAGGGCIFVDSAVGRYLMSAYAVPSDSAAELIAGHVYLLTSYGIQTSAAELANIQALGRQGDAQAVVESLLSLTKSAKDFTAQRAETVGDNAIWVSKSLGAVRQGFLLAARAEALVGVDVVVTFARDEKSVRDAAVYVVGQMLGRLPPRFFIAIPTPLPPPTLASSVTRPASGSPSTTEGPPGTAGTPGPGASGTQSSTTPLPAASVTPARSTPTATLKPPAFSVPIVSSGQLSYGPGCGLSLATFTVTVADPSQVSPITAVALFVRVVDPVTGGSTAWNSLSMRQDSGNVWLGTLNAETQLPGHEKFAKAAVEYYFTAANSAGGTAESPHYGVESHLLTLTVCGTSAP